jgi:coenzyme F420-0:L-glutamate ligase / coenzyme F420-1:gamma-L-glutamate ligase
MSEPLTIYPLAGIGEVGEGADLAALLCDALAATGIALQAGDIVAVAQKIVSKAEDRTLDLGKLAASAEAVRLAGLTGKEPQLVEAVLGESSEVLRAKRNVLIVRHRLGLVMANAGIDRSNVPAPCGEDRVLLLPRDPDASACAIRAGIEAHTGVAPGIIVTDSFGRAWRNGVVNVAIGAAGIASLVDRRGEVDREGRELQVTEVALADALAAAAGVVMGEGAESCPVVLIRGVPAWSEHLPAAALIRPLDEDMFR